ncbi:YtxH domain-containing protein [Dyadobacter sp. 3J3]|uniref:YtxH domain-containing protein n=1 Tax=Dyadobacter sp. 3J3 TaxID=2606600 RepID=UPI0013590F2B|nr:YtxH domain-containing protein [Dyadobacter sp. 3J3]
MTIGKGLCSLLLAGSAGFAIGLLLAPDKGSQTRKKRQQKAEDFLDDEITGYNRIVCNVKTKIDAILNGISIPVDDNISNWADADQKMKNDQHHIKV